MLAAALVAVAVSVVACDNGSQVSPVPDAPTSRQSAAPSAPQTTPPVVNEPWEILQPDPGFDFSPVVIPVVGDPNRSFDCGPDYYVARAGEGEWSLEGGPDTQIVIERQGTNIYIRMLPDNELLVGGVVNGQVPFVVPLEADGTLIDVLYADERSGEVDSFREFTLCFKPYDPAA